MTARCERSTKRFNESWLQRSVCLRLTSGAWTSWSPVACAPPAAYMRLTSARAFSRAPRVQRTPTMIALEKATNPFLRAGDAGLRAHLGMEGASDAEVFAEVRRRKDNF